MNYDIKDLNKYIKEKDIVAVKALMIEHHLIVKDGMLVADKDEAKLNKVFWNQRQQARKILLNSLYGALLNSSMKFYDKRVGQSVTLTGRSIARHMNSKINEIITGVYDYKGDAIIYADTDSSYFSAKAVWQTKQEFKDFEFTRDNIIALYDGIGEDVNDTFPEFMNKNFNTGLTRGRIIRAGRELVACKGLFIKKKKYAVLMYDKDGHRYDRDGKVGKLKVMGLDLKRSDTPQYMQDFLEKILLGILTNQDKEESFALIKEFRTEFRKKPSWEKGSPKKINGLTTKTNMVNKIKSIGRTNMMDIEVGEKGHVNMAGHVKAAINYMTLRKLHNDNFSMPLTDGSKAIVCVLKTNALGMTSIAYPVDEPNIPQWFKDLPFDDEAMENNIIDKKLYNLVNVLKWDMAKTNSDLDNDLFSW